MRHKPLALQWAPRGRVGSHHHLLVLLQRGCRGRNLLPRLGLSGQEPLRLPRCLLLRRRGLVSAALTTQSAAGEERPRKRSEGKSHAHFRQLLPCDPMGRGKRETPSTATSEWSSSKHHGELSVVDSDERQKWSRVTRAHAPRKSADLLQPPLARTLAVLPALLLFLALTVRRRGSGRVRHRRALPRGVSQVTNLGASLSTTRRTSGCGCSPGAAKGLPAPWSCSSAASIPSWAPRQLSTRLPRLWQLSGRRGPWPRAASRRRGRARARGRRRRGAPRQPRGPSAAAPPAPARAPRLSRRTPPARGLHGGCMGSAAGQGRHRAGGGETERTGGRASSRSSSSIRLATRPSGGASVNPGCSSAIERGWPRTPGIP
jgi:hypothetical protein